MLGQWIAAVGLLIVVEVIQHSAVKLAHDKTLRMKVLASVFVWICNIAMLVYGWNYFIELFWLVVGVKSVCATLYYILYIIYKRTDQ